MSGPIIHHQVSMPSSVLANQGAEVPAPECCCFSARFVNLILFLFNFIFLLSGCCILLLTVLYGRPEVSRYLGETTKYLNNIISLLGNGHLVQIIHYSMLFCGVVIIVVSLLNIIFSTATSWSKSSDYYYYHRRRRRQLKENDEALLYYNTTSTLDSSRPSMNGSRASSEDSPTTEPKSHIRNQSQHGTIRSSENGDRQRHPLQQQPKQTGNQRQRHHGSFSHFANSTVVLCCYIFVLLFLFTVQLVIGLLSVITVSPERMLISTHTADDDDFLISVRDSVDIPDLLVNRADEIQKLYGPFQCCGWIYYDDYEYLTIDGQRNASIWVPDSCCKTYVKNCGKRKHPNNIYYDGCWSKFGTEMRDYVLMLGWAALGFAIIELIGLMFAVCHYVQIVSKS